MQRVVDHIPLKQGLRPTHFNPHTIYSVVVGHIPLKQGWGSWLVRSVWGEGEGWLLYSIREIGVRWWYYLYLYGAILVLTTGGIGNAKL